MAKGSPISIRAYAKLRDCSHSAVRRAIADGRLRKSLGERAGKVTIKDPDLADREWAENTQHDRVPLHIKKLREKLEVDAGGKDFVSRAAEGARKAREAAIAGDDEDLPSAKMGDSLTRADAIKKVWEAVRIEQIVRREAGELVDGREVEERWSDIITAARTKLLGIPSKVKQRIPKLTRKETEIIDTLIREALEGLAP